MMHSRPCPAVPQTLVLVIAAAVDRRAAYQRHLQADEARSYRWLEADTLAAGLRQWQTHQPEVVLLDMELPDGDGGDLLAAMAAGSASSPLPIIVLIESGDERTALRALQLGAADYLVKGEITALSLAVRIQQVLERTALHQQLRRSQRQTALIAETLLQIHQSSDSQTILDSTVQQVQAFLKADRVVIYQFNPGDMSGRIVAEAVVPPFQPSLAAQIEDTCFQTNKGGAYRQGRVFVADDIYQAGLSDCHLELLEQFQVRANLVVPIVLPQEEVQPLWGLLVAHQCSGPRHWEASDVQLLEQLAVQVAIALQQAELYRSLHALNVSLEDQVQTRTAELKASRNRFQGIFDGMFQFTGLLSPDGILLEANETALRAGGFSRDAVVGQPFWEAPWWQASPATPGELRQAIERAAQGEFVRYEVEVLTANQTTTPIDFSLRPLTDDQGEVVLLIPEGRDLTEAKRLQAERAEAFRLLQESEQLYASLTAAAPVGIFRMDATGDCSYVNDRYCQITGLTPALAQGQRWRPWVHPEDRDAAIGEWERCVQAGDRGQIECRFQRPDGTICWVYIQIVGHPNAAGQVVDYIGTLTDISERKQAEAALQESEAFRRAITDVAPVGIFVYDLQQETIVFGNPAYEAQLGYSVAEIQALGRHFWASLYEPEQRAELEAGDRALMADRYGQTLEREYTVRRKDGTALRGLCRELVLNRHPDGTPAQILGIALDISDRQRAEAERLKAAEVQKAFHLVESVLDIISAGYWDWHLTADTFYYSPGLKRMLGYADEELPNRPETWQQLIFAEDLPQAHQQLEQHIQTSGKTPFHVEERYHHKDGSTVWVLCSGQVVEWDEAGKPRRMIGCHLDISDRKQAEIQLEQQLAAIEAAIDGIGILQHGRYIYLNRAHVELFGFQQASDLLGQSWRQIYSAEALAEFEQTIFPALTRDRCWRGETTARRRDGTTFAQELSLTLTDEDILICVCRDISDRKAAEAQLKLTNQQLERATRLKDEFLANMSHELRTPLNAILGMNEGLQEQVFGPLNQRQMEALETVERSGLHLLDLINDILDLAKIESGHIALDLAVVDTAQLCESSLAFIKQQALKKQITLALRLPASLPPLEADERRVRQVLINLLTNAVKFTPVGGQVTLAAELRPSSPSSRTQFLQLSVTDTGIGIAPDQLSQLFQPFIQVDSALNRQYEGTGLGLALVKRTVELHGGQVGVTSAVGVGSCFTVDLPCGGGDSPTPLQVVSRHPGSQPHPSEPSPSAPSAPLLLLAEDNEASIMTTCNYLSARGFRLCTAKDGYAAVSLAAAERPDLIIMDIQMPGMDGLAAIRAIRHQPEIADIPIIALTALAMERDQERCLAAGADAYLSKPVRLKQLTDQIVQMLPTPP